MRDVLLHGSRLAEVTFDRVEMVIGLSTEELGSIREKRGEQGIGKKHLWIRHIIIRLAEPHIVSRSAKHAQHEATHLVLVPTGTAHRQVDPWAHQYRATRQRVALVAEVEHGSCTESSTRAVPSKNDILWRDFEVFDEPEIGGYGIVKRAGKMSLGCETVVDGKNTHFRVLNEYSHERDNRLSGKPVKCVYLG
jgi:hypothetical protein